MAVESSRESSHEDTIILDLLPDTTDAGKLQEQSDAEFLALKDFKSLYHFEVKPSLRIHGTGKFEEDKPARPASLLVFAVQAIPYRTVRPIRRAIVKITFEKDAKPSAAAKRKAPRVRNVAPGREPPLMIDCTKEKLDVKDTVEGNAEVQGGGGLGSGNIGAKRAREKDREKELQYFTSVTAVMQPTPDHRFSNQAQWIFEENRSQSTGIAPDMTLAVLLELSEEGGEFTATVEVEVEIDWLGSLQEWFMQFPKWKRKAEPYTVDPAKSVTGGGTFELDEMHVYKDKDKIRPLWYINMRKTYTEFETTPQGEGQQGTAVEQADQEIEF